MSVWLMRLLLAQYVALMVWCAFEGRKWESLYWLGASCITLGLMGLRVA